MVEFLIMSEAPNLESEIVSLCQKARDLGASQAVGISATEVAVDERVLLKCMVPVCPHYDMSLLCPPNVLSASSFREALGRYSRAILIKVDAASPGPAGPLDQEYLDCLGAAQKKLYEVVGRVEAACLERGYCFAAGLVAGACTLCQECVGHRSGLPCRHPFEARPSMEAVGIDVVATAERAGLSLSFAPDAGRGWVGLVLVD